MSYRDDKPMIQINMNKLIEWVFFPLAGAILGFLILMTAFLYGVVTTIDRIGKGTHEVYVNELNADGEPTGWDIRKVEDD